MCCGFHNAERKFITVPLFVLQRDCRTAYLHPRVRRVPLMTLKLNCTNFFSSLKIVDRHVRSILFPKLELQHCIYNIKMCSVNGFKTGLCYFLLLSMYIDMGEAFVF